jgi:hypothetical protein
MNDCLVLRQGPKEAQKAESGPADCYLSELHSQLKKLVESRPGHRVPVQEDEAEDPKVGSLAILVVSSSMVRPGPLREPPLYRYRSSSLYLISSLLSRVVDPDQDWIRIQRFCGSGSVLGIRIQGQEISVEKCTF